MATHIVDSFSMLTLEQVEKMIGAAQGKACQLDPAQIMDCERVSHTVVAVHRRAL